MGGTLWIEPQHGIQHIRLVQTYTTACCPSAAMEKDGAATVRDGIGRCVDSIGVLGYAVPNAHRPAGEVLVFRLRL